VISLDTDGNVKEGRKTRNKYLLENHEINGLHTMRWATLIFKCKVPYIKDKL
jgi:hypothetical protein